MFFEHPGGSLNAPGGLAWFLLSLQQSKVTNNLRYMLHIAE